jgi:hypothetical protein
MNIETLCGDTRKDLGGSSFGFPNFDLFQPENTGRVGLLWLSPDVGV